MIVERACPRCGAVIHDVVEPRPAGRPRRWCSLRCRRAASEERHAAANGAIAIEYVTVQADLDEHVRAVLESPTACRRVLRDVRERAEAGLLESARWGSVHSEIERLRPRAASPMRWRLR